MRSAHQDHRQCFQRLLKALKVVKGIFPIVHYATHIKKKPPGGGAVNVIADLIIIWCPRVSLTRGAGAQKPPMRAWQQLATTFFSP
jgi:hypothetical protein